MATTPAVPSHQPPPVLIVEPHTFCNLTCASCLTGQRKLPRPTGTMPFASYSRLIDEIAPWVKIVQFSGMGEPLLNENCLDYLSYLSNAGIDAWVDTNGHFFRNQSFVDRLLQTNPARINIAIDGTDQASLAAARGPHADFKKLTDGIHLLIESKKRLQSECTVNLQFIVSRPNEHLVADFFALGRSLQPDSLTIKAIRLDPNDHQACATLMPRSGRYRGYTRATNGEWRPKGKMIRQCWAIHQYCLVWWDGTLLPCCFDLDGTYAYGNVFETSFETAWNSTAARQFRQRTSDNLASVPMCGICPVGRTRINCWEFEADVEEKTRYSEASIPG